MIEKKEDASCIQFLDPQLLKDQDDVSDVYAVLYYHGSIQWLYHLLVWEGMLCREIRRFVSTLLPPTI